jgi:hypothetical protein
MDSERSAKVHKAAERFWLIATLAAAAAAAHAIITEGWDEGKSMLIICGLAALWYGFRRGFRKRLERNA